MLNRNSIKLSDYIAYPFLIPSIYLDFNIGENYVVVQSSMIVKPTSKVSSELILKGNQIKLLSISIDRKELTSEQYIISGNELIVHNPPLLEFELQIKSKINPFLLR